MYQVVVKFNSLHGLVESSSIFKDIRECYSFRDTFPIDRVVSWSISPVLVQPPCESSEMDKPSNVFRVSLMLRNKPSLIVKNVHIDTLKDAITMALQQIDFKDLQHIRLFYE